MQPKHQFERVRWHSRRGMLELDLMLVPFAEHCFASLDAIDQDRYVKLLACEDQDLLAWLLEHAEPQDPDIAHIVRLIRSSHGAAATHPG